MIYQRDTLAHELPERVAGTMPLNSATPVLAAEARALTPIYYSLADAGSAAWAEETRPRRVARVTRGGSGQGGVDGLQ